MLTIINTENSIKEFRTFLSNKIKEGDILLQFTGKIEIKWEVVEVMPDKLYAVDNDGFGCLFDFSELDNNWKFQNKNDNK